jgi:plasmid maintenance system killer protein
MKIGYANNRLEKFCTKISSAKKDFPAGVAKLLLQRMTQLAAFERLSDVPAQTPCFRHRLTQNLAGHYSVRIDKKFRIVFIPTGEFETLPDNTPDLKTVTSIEITSVEDYHDV